MRFTRRQLALKALRVLQEAADQCERSQGPIAPSFGLRFALAWLTNRDSRSIADTFWLSCTTGPTGDGAPAFGRSQTLNCALKYIARLHGIEPRDRY